MTTTMQVLATVSASVLGAVVGLGLAVLYAIGEERDPVEDTAVVTR